jgi:hypothetical protein
VSEFGFQLSLRQLGIASAALFSLVSAAGASRPQGQAAPVRDGQTGRPAALPGQPSVPEEVAARLAREHASADDFEHESLTTALAGRLGAALPKPGGATAAAAVAATAPLEALLAESVHFAAPALPLLEVSAKAPLAAGITRIGGQSKATDGTTIVAGGDPAPRLTRADAARAFAAALGALPGAAPWKQKVLRSERVAEDRLMMLVKLAPRPSVDTASGATFAAFARVRFEWTTTKGEDERNDPAVWALDSVRFEEQDLVRARVGLDDVTAHVLAPSPRSRAQLVPSIASLGLGLDTRLGVGFLGHHGLAVADVNGDGLDDLYLCQPGGLPDQLWMRRPDGTAVEVAATLGLDMLDYSSSALFVDLDNDGDQDLVRTTSSALVVQVNKGGGAFPEAFVRDIDGATSLAAADVDLDGLVDVFLCTYGSPYTGGGLPLPFHDARNGTQNLLLANRSAKPDELAFEDVTVAAGMGGPDQRFSFAASFEDYDDDGDQDLYVANDFGRNHLWRNDRSAEAPFRFVDVAAELNVEDIASGMGVTWADFDLDGVSDVYVSNMFSSAGNRIGFDRRFHADAGADALGHYRRHASGNSLFLARDGAFEYTGEASLGLWAWGGLAFELDGDGRPDLYVPNGFVTGTNPDDL